MKKLLVLLLPLIFILNICYSSPGESDTIVMVDFSKTSGKLLHNAMGFHHGIGVVKPRNELIQPLNPILVRTYEEDVFPRANKLGFKVQYQNTNKEAVLKGINENDWSDWIDHSEERARNASGHDHVYIDIFNEPNYFMRSNNLAWKSFFEAWEVAYNSIKGIDSSIIIVGPSIDNYFHTEVREFLTYCRDKDVIPEIFAFHSSNYLYLKKETNDLRHLIELLSIEEDILGISLNEYAIKTKMPRPCPPGILFRYLPLIEDSRLTSAALSNHLHDNLSCAVTEGYPQYRRPLWFACEAYASMEGERVEISSFIDIPGRQEEVDGIATWDAINSKGTILLGSGKQDMGNVVVKLKNLPGIFSENVLVNIFKIPYNGYDVRYSSGDGTLEAPDTISYLKNYEIIDGDVLIELTEFGEMDGFVIEIISPGNTTAHSKSVAGGLAIYPNPCSSGILHIQSDFLMESIRLYNLSGKLIKDLRLSKVNNYTMEINGEYESNLLINITGYNNEYISRKLIIR